MKIIENTHDHLTLRAIPWVSYALHGVLGFGFLIGFLFSAWQGENLWLTLGFAGGLAFIIRVCAFQLQIVSAAFNRTAGTITVIRRSGRGRVTTTHQLADLKGYDIGHERDGDATSVIINFGPTNEAVELPASSNGFLNTRGQVDVLEDTIKTWCGRKG